MNALLNHIIEAVKCNEEADERTILVVHDCFEKIELFMGHRVRVVHQQRALAKIIHDMSTRATQNGEMNEAFVTIDFKMKTEPIYFREKTLEHYGKRGMSWHGAMVQFWAAEPSSASSNCEITEEKVYYNHISGSDNRQDKEAVAALIEAVLIDIKRDLPQINRIVLQSDNASSYQNAFIAVILPVLGIANGIEIAQFVHTETQDGKSLLDAQFARAAKKVRAWAKQGHDCATPRALVEALIADGGLPNTMAEIVEYDRESLRLLSSEIQPMEKAFARITGRLNDIRYEYDRFPRVQEDETAFKLQFCSKILVQAFTYSNVEAAKLLELDPSVGTCKILRDEINDELAPSRTEEVEATTHINDTLEELNSDDDAEFDFDGDGGEENLNTASNHKTSSGVVNADVGLLDAESTDTVSEIESADEDDAGLDLSAEIVLPRHVVGRLTGVRVTTEAQIRRRMNTWMCPHDSVVDLPTTRKHHKTEKSVTAYAKQSLINMKNAGSLAVADVSDLPQRMMALVDQYPGDIPRIELDQGWAQRPAKGKMYGKKYIRLYIEEVTEMFKRGADNKSDKMGPARMVEALQCKHPNRYDVPGESEVRTVISKLFAGQRKRAAPTSDQSLQPQPKKRFRMEQPYTDFLKELLVSDPNILPRHALLVFRKEFPDADNELYTDDRVKHKLTTIKHSSRKA